MAEDKSIFRAYLFSECNTNRPVQLLYPHLKGLPTNTSNFGPLSKALFFSVKFYEYITRCVSALFKIRSPSAILWKITPRIVCAIQSLVFGSCAHVFQEVLKFVPPLTNRYAATAIPIIMRVCHIGTPYHHADPRSPFSGVRQAVLEKPFSRQASTTSYMPPCEICSDYNYLVSALAGTLPQGLPSAIFPSETERCKSPRVIASQIFNLVRCHNFQIIAQGRE